MDPRDEHGGKEKGRRRTRGKDDSQKDERGLKTPGSEKTPQSADGNRKTHPAGRNEDKGPLEEGRRSTRHSSLEERERASAEERSSSRPPAVRPGHDFSPRKEKATNGRVGVGSGMPPDPWSNTHPPRREPSDQRGDNGGFFGRGPLRFLYEHKPGDPTVLPPEAGRSSEQSYHGRSGYRAGEVSPRQPTERARSPLFLLALALALVVVAYLLSLAF